MIRILECGNWSISSGLLSHRNRNVGCIDLFEGLVSDRGEIQPHGQVMKELFRHCIDKKTLSPSDMGSLNKIIREFLRRETERRAFSKLKKCLMELLYEETKPRKAEDFVMSIGDEFTKRELEYFGSEKEARKAKRKVSKIAKEFWKRMYGKPYFEEFLHREEDEETDG